MQRMIGFYNSEVRRFNQGACWSRQKIRESKVDGFIDTIMKK
jgi:hypothetical protein